MNTVLPLTVLQTSWAILLGCQALLWIARGGGVLIGYGTALFMVVAAYSACIVKLHRRSGAAWWLCWIPPAASLAIAGPRIFQNLYLMLRDNDLYHDSPGTGIIVCSYAIVFVVFPVGIMASLVWVRRGMSPNKPMKLDGPSAHR